jgi:hypothetical protein
MGVIGFVRHLSRGHGVKPDQPNTRLEWIITRCTYREVPEDEIAALTEDLPGTRGPPKMPFRKSNRDSTGSDQNAQIAVKRRPTKRASELLELSDEEPDDSEMDLDGGDPDFNPSGSRRSTIVESAKKRRISTAQPSPKQSLRVKKSTAKL